MKDLDIRIALAELQGLSGPWTPKERRLEWGEHYLNHQGHRLPELTLDWLHEIEAGEQVKGVRFHLIYPEELRKLCGQGSEYFATARQRAESALRVFGKWMEGCQ